MTSLKRRVYYDHEPAWQRIAAAGGRGWDDLYADPQDTGDSYEALDAFLASTFVPRGQGRKAIDLGCGGGQAAFRVARAGFDARGIDYAESAIDLARRNAREMGLPVRFDVADALDATSLPEAAFDLVLDNHCLHCIVDAGDRHAFLANARRILEPDGVFFCDTMSREGGWDAARADADAETGITRNRTRIWVSRRQLEAELVAAGFEMEQVFLRPQREKDRWAGDMLTVHARPSPRR